MHARLLLADVGDEAAEGAKACHETRDHVALEAEDIRHVGNMQRGGAAATDEEALARIDALPHRDLLYGRHHVVIRSRVDREGCLLAADADARGNRVDRRLGEIAAQLDAAAKEIIRIDKA